MRKGRWILVVTSVSLLILCAGFCAGFFIHSPNEEAIRNSSVLPRVTARAELRELPPLRATAKGVAHLGRTWSVSAYAREGASPLVTHTYAQNGDHLASGALVAEVAGRPVIALELGFDLYRDIVGGSAGPDVIELQHALAGVGVYRGKVDGLYGPQTAEAVKNLYQRLSVEPPEVLESDQEALEEAISALQSAERERDSAEHERNSAGQIYSEGEQPSLESDTRETENSSAQAQQNLLRAQRAYNKASLANLTPLRMSEILSLPIGGAQLLSLSGVNTLVSEESPLATLRTGGARATVRVSVGDKDMFVSGTELTVALANDSTVTFSGIAGVLSEFHMAEPHNGSDIAGYDLTVDIGNSEGLTDGANVVVTSTKGAAQSGIAVPISALRSQASGAYVVLASNNEKVPVSVSRTHDGWAFLEKGTITEGTDVIVAVP